VDLVKKRRHRLDPGRSAATDLDGLKFAGMADAEGVLLRRGSWDEVQEGTWDETSLRIGMFFEDIYWEVDGICSTRGSW
jgi:hypothetical protein